MAYICRPLQAYVIMANHVHVLLTPLIAPSRLLRVVCHSFSKIDLGHESLNDVC